MQKPKRYNLLFIALGLLLPFQALADEGWSWTTEPTPGSSNMLVNEDGEVEEDYSNGDLSKDIMLSEIMPNPEGTDTDVEWIEIYNAGSTDIDLGNWTLDDEEEGSSAYTFPAGTTIEAQDFLVVYRSESDISLNNDVDQVRLFDYEQTLQDSVEYLDSPEGQSYARISLEKETAYIQSWLARWIPQAHASEPEESTEWGSWEWTNEVTAGSTNPTYYKIEGIIEEIIAFEDKILLKTKEKLTQVSLSKLELSEELKKSIFQPGNKITGYATLNKDQSYTLKKFEQTESTPLNQTSKGSKKYLFLVGMLLCGGGIYAYSYYKKSSNLVVA